jgi:3-isopropylmalate dehydrogenase
MQAVIVLLPGDGIGREVTAAARTVLAAVAEAYCHRFVFDEHLIGGAAIDVTGDPLPGPTLAACQRADAVLLGAVGGPRWARSPVRPEEGLLRLRRGLGAYANLRPIVPHPAMAEASPLKTHLLEGVDMLFVRELTGGIYFGDKRRDARGATDVCSYSREEVARVVRLACEQARARRGRVTSVDKANVLETSRLWRETATRVVAEEFPDVHLEHALVDAAAMQLILDPRRYDVIVTENMFGDILTDEASVITGSIGMLPSASLGGPGPGLYEPIHGSAPDIAGRGVANPYGAILSGAMLLRHSLRLEREAAAVEAAVWDAVAAGVRTPDAARAGARTVTTREAAEAVASCLQPPRRLRESVG